MSNSIVIDFYFAYVHITVGSLNEAMQSYDAGLLIDPSNAESKNERNQLQKGIEKITEIKQIMKNKEYRKAIPMIDNLSRTVIGSNYRDLNILKVECLVETDKTEEAYNLTNAMLRNNCDVIDSDLLYLRSKCFYVMGDIDNGLKNISKSMKSDPDNTVYRKFYRKMKEIEEHKENGNAAFKKNDLQEAITYWTSAINIDIKNHKVVAKLYSNRATALFKLKRYEESIQDCNRCIANDAAFIKAYTRRAECHFAIGGTVYIYIFISFLKY